MDSKTEFNSESNGLLEKLLKEDPGYNLSDDFADKLMHKIEIQQSVKQNTIEFFTVLGTVIGILITFCCTYYYLNKENFIQLKSLVFNGYTPIIVVFVLFIYFMDKVMLRLFNLLK